MTNKLAVIINSLKVPKSNTILLYEMKFRVPNYSSVQNPLTRGLPPPDPRSFCLLSSTEFVEPPSPQNKIPGYVTGSSGRRPWLREECLRPRVRSRCLKTQPSIVTGDRGSTVVKVLCYKSEGRWFDPSWCHWIFHWHKILPIALWPWGRLTLLKGLSTRSISWG